jgi:hypothetical protein
VAASLVTEIRDGSTRLAQVGNSAFEGEGPHMTTPLDHLHNSSEQVGIHGGGRDGFELVDHSNAHESQGFPFYFVRPERFETRQDRRHP